MLDQTVTYSGTQGNDYRRVLVHYVSGASPVRLEIGPSQKVRHKSDSFAWGYGGSGPAQLALALLLDFTGLAPLAEVLYQELKRDIVARLPRDEGWEITGRQLGEWLMGKLADADPARLGLAMIGWCSEQLERGRR